ncbi:hypothetical protein PFISCL1PPCAC_28683, partial [Pristionchus fissidentatus]
LQITGHSLGGSMASIAAAMIVKEQLWQADKIRVVTFGEPRTGNGEYSATMAANIPNMHRVVHLNDVVVHKPWAMWGYKHTQQEIYYDNDMSDFSAFVACNDSEEEDLNCSDRDSFLKRNVGDHITYYGLVVSAYGMQGCTGTTK